MHATAPSLVHGRHDKSNPNAGKPWLTAYMLCSCYLFIDSVLIFFTKKKIPIKFYSSYSHACLEPPSPFPDPPSTSSLFLIPQSELRSRQAYHSAPSRHFQSQCPTGTPMQQGHYQYAIRKDTLKPVCNGLCADSM